LNGILRDPASFAGQGNLTDAWFGGGDLSGGIRVNVDRIIF
jgi:hypothetical protein